MWWPTGSILLKPQTNRREMEGVGWCLFSLLMNVQLVLSPNMKSTSITNCRLDSASVQPSTPKSLSLILITDKRDRCGFSTYCDWAVPGISDRLCKSLGFWYFNPTLKCPNWWFSSNWAYVQRQTCKLDADYWYPKWCKLISKDFLNKHRLKWYKHLGGLSKMKFCLIFCPNTPSNW